MKRIMMRIVDLVFYYVFGGIVSLFLAQLFCYTSFRIPSDLGSLLTQWSRH